MRQKSRVSVQRIASISCVQHMLVMDFGVLNLFAVLCLVLIENLFHVNTDLLVSAAEL